MEEEEGEAKPDDRITETRTQSRVGHNRGKLEKIAETYKPPEPGSSKNKKKSKKSGYTRKTNSMDQAIPKNLFDILPFRDEDLNEEEDKPYVVVPYLPNGTYHKLKRACNKAGVNLVTRPGRKLGSILCSANKTPHDPKDQPGVYWWCCECSPNAQYIGQTIRPINIRAKEHERAVNNGNWGHSGICQHRQNCTVNAKWDFKVITNMTNKNKKKLTYDLKVREALEIRRHNCGPGSGLNEDLGAYVKTTMWDPVFHQMNNDSGVGEGANP